MFISDLDETFPDGQLQRGFVIDDDLREIKQFIKNTFPNASAAINPTVPEFNRLQGVTSNIQNQLNAIIANIIPGGAKAVFVQAAAPTGWVHDTSFNDRYLRPVSTWTTGSGGTHNPTGLVHNHTHLVSGDTTAPSQGDENVAPGVTSVARQAHTHPVNITSAQPNNNAITGGASWRLAYYDCIVCTKSNYTVP